MTRLSDFTKAKAGDWIAETFIRPTVSGGVGVFELTGTATGYTAFGDHFNEGDIVFYAAFDDACNRECGFARYSTSGAVPTLTPVESNATLANGVFVDGDVKPIPFPKGGTITGTFNSEAFNAIWNHIWDKNNPHEVEAFQVHQSNSQLGDNVQTAIDTLLKLIKAIEISEELELEVLMGMIKQLQKDVARLEDAIETEKYWRIDSDLKLKDAIEKEIEDREREDNRIEGKLDAEIEARGEGDEELHEKLNQEISDRQDGDDAVNKRIDELATDDLTDVNSANASVDQFLIHNGVQWVAEDFHIDTELTFKGGISVPNDPAPAAVNGDLYINNEDGVAGASWTGIAGRTINAANAVGWSDKNSRWYMLGDIASAAVMRVEAGTGIDVNDDKPAEPVVSIDRTEVDKWYADAGHLHDDRYEPIINPKNTAFNKDFGILNDQVARGDHLHDDRYLQQKDFIETDPTVPQHVKNITTVDIGRWDEAHGWGDHSQEGYLKAGDIDVGDPDWAFVRSDAEYEKVIAFGAPSDSTIVDQECIAIGFECEARYQSVAIGHGSEAGDAGIALGRNAVAGPDQFAISPDIDSVNFRNAKVQATDYLDADGNSIISGDYSLPLAANGTRGGVQVGYTTNAKNYAVQLSGEKMFVNVPWTDTQTDLTGYATQAWCNSNFDNYGWWNVTVDGATTSQMISKSTLDFRGAGGTTVSKSGNTITISSTTSSGGSDYTLPLAANGTRGGVQTGFTTSGKNYAVQLSGEKMYVNVPWTDNNTTYSQATSTTLGLVKIGFTTNSSSRNYAVQLSNGQMYVNVPWVEGTGGGTTYSAGNGISLSGTTFNVAAGNGISHTPGNDGVAMNGTYTGDFSVTGNITATKDITAYSDERLKKNIVTAPTDVISQLRGVEFEWAEDGRFGSGVIAQEVEQVLPHLVHDQEDGNKSVNYMGLVGYLIEEVKALRAEVEALRDSAK